jgi:polyhydroxyalkanoate synthesis regulator phasin
MTERAEFDSKVDDLRVRSRATAHSLADIAKTALLVGVSAAGLVADEANLYLNKLAERGTEAQQSARTRLDDLARRASTRATRRDELEHRIEEVLGQVNAATRSDIAELTARLEALNARLDALKAPHGTWPAGEAVDAGELSDSAAASVIPTTPAE